MKTEPNIEDFKSEENNLSIRTDLDETESEEEIRQVPLTARLKTFLQKKRSVIKYNIVIIGSNLHTFYILKQIIFQLFYKLIKIVTCI